MLREFNECNLQTNEDHYISSLIMMQADDIATQITELECKVNDIQCYNETIENGSVIQRFTEEAQDIFNSHYDHYITELYSLLNQQLSGIL